MFIIDDIIGWIIAKILDKFFSKKEDNLEVIKLYESRMRSLQGEKEQLAENLSKAKETHKKEQTRVIDSLKRRGLSVEKLIEKYDKPLNAILISYVTQKAPTTTGYYKDTKFVREELKRFNVKSIGGCVSLIPPSKVPPHIKDRKDLKEWFEKEILKGRFCKVPFLILFDLKKHAFWNTYLPYKQKKPFYHTIGESLSVEDLFTEKQINKIALSTVIKDGDITWFASSVLGESEVDIIIKNQAVIEKSLGNPSLRVLANNVTTAQLSKSLSPFLKKPDDVAKAIIEEAKYWDSKLK